MSGAIGPGRGLLGINIQGRHNPKQKESYRYEPGDGVLEFANREDQSDVRDGTDYSANGELAFPVGTGDLKLTGFVVHTDRTESETSREYEDLTSVDPADLTVLTPQFEDISQDNYTLAAAITQKMFGGETGFSGDFTRFSEDVVSTEVETEYDPYPDVDDFGGTRTFSDTVDRAWSLRIDHKHPIGMATLEIGADYNNKKRDGDIAEAEIDSPGDAYPDPEPVTGGFYTIEEEWIDPFAMVSGTSGAFSWEAGMRYEHTTSKIVDRVTDISGKADYGFILPSGHIRFQLNDQDRISLSAVRTVRRPNFDSLAPVLLEEEPIDESDFLGNPDLKPENAWGFDIGYERRLGARGVSGVNFFYRDISDLIELTSTGEVSSSGDGLVFQPRNVGNGQVWGVEFDFSAPLTVIGLPNTGLFLNYSWLNSSLTDPVDGRDRRFNDQAKSVLNVGFIHDVPEWGASFGTSYRKQGSAFSQVQGETVKTTYGGDLEVFVEKRFGEHFTLRLTGSNLLDAHKDEVFNKWDTIADQLSGDVDALDEFERETEKAGPVFQLVGRVSF